MFVAELTLLFVLMVLLLVSIWTFGPLVFGYLSRCWDMVTRYLVRLLSAIFDVLAPRLIQPVKEVLAALTPRFMCLLNQAFKLFSEKAQRQIRRALRYLDGKLVTYRRRFVHNGESKEAFLSALAWLYKQVRDTSKLLFAWTLHALVGEQRLQVDVAALIEAPLRIGPDQRYFVRIRLNGRDRPAKPEGGQIAGLSSLSKGELVHIEICATLFERSAYAVYQACIPMPASGYETVITMPMKPPFSRPSGQYERVYISFTDEQGHPFYEKPFVVELFVSRHVRPGREGYNALAVPHLM